MTEQQAAYQRLLDWCAQAARNRGLTVQATVIEGTRTITHQPLGAPGERERGTIDNKAFDGEQWLGDNVGQVIAQMDDQLGPVPEDAYQICE